MVKQEDDRLLAERAKTVAGAGRLSPWLSRG